MRPAALAALVVLGLASAAQAGGMSPKATFLLHCSGCHGSNGEGTVKGGIPSLPGSVGHIARLDEGRTYITHVPGVVGASLSNAEIAAVMNYILDTWAEGEAAHFTEEEVTRRRAVPVADVVEMRRGIVADLAAKGVDLAEYPWP